MPRILVIDDDDAGERGHDGYPRAVPASIVPLGARIIGVADAFDTMIHARPFRGAPSGTRGIE